MKQAPSVLIRAEGVLRQVDARTAALNRRAADAVSRRKRQPADFIKDDCCLSPPVPAEGDATPEVPGGG